MLFSIDSRQPRKRQHQFPDPLYETEKRVAFKGQFFSAPMDWPSIVEQFNRMEKEATHILPISGVALSARVRIAISAGLTDLNGLH